MKNLPGKQDSSAAPSEDAQPQDAQPQDSGSALVEALLARQTRPAPPAAPVHGVVVGAVTEHLPNGKVGIAIPSLGIEATVATPVCAPDALVPGSAAAVMFEQGDTARALIIGPMASGSVAAQQPEPPREALIDRERVVIEAEQEIELRCGEAAIVLTRDGRILLRGAYISSHASATQRILGGAVHIN